MNIFFIRVYEVNYKYKFIIEIAKKEYATVVLKAFLGKEVEETFETVLIQVWYGAWKEILQAPR